MPCVAKLLQTDIDFCAVTVADFKYFGTRYEVTGTDSAILCRCSCRNYRYRLSSFQQ